MRQIQSGFDPEIFLSTVSQGRTLLACTANQTIFSQADPANAVFYVQKGDVKIVVTSEQGKEAVVGIVKAGDFFGEGCLLGQPLRLGSALVMSRSIILRVEKAEMVRVLHEEPAFAEVFMTHLLTRNSRVEADLVDHLFNSSEKRLARTLLLLASFGTEGAPQPISPKVTQETLAAIVGTTRPRISHFMNKFRKLGFIDFNGSIQINSSLLTVLLRE